MKIPQQTIEAIRRRIDIVDIVSKYVRLTKAGKNFKGLCPFHSEKTPSFTVSRDKQIYYCFGCHNGGNAFTFVMEFNKINWVEAVEELAREAGVTIMYEDGHGTDAVNETEELLEINVTAARYYAESFVALPESHHAKKYLLAERKLLPKTIRTFGIGYAPSDRKKLPEVLTGKGHDLQKAEKLGIVGQGNNGYYDKINDRIVFPIFSTSGRVIAFAGRTLEKNPSSAKYINSPETPVYHKSNVLYGLSFAKEHIRKHDYAVLVEGYMDLLSLYQEGIQNVIAVSGTALTEQQIHLIARFTKNIYILFDADNAGQSAALRSIEILLKQDMIIKYIELPAGEDPDSYIHTYGKTQFQERVKDAKDFFEYQFSVYQSRGLFESPEKAAEAIRELVKPLALIQDQLRLQLILQNLANVFSLRVNLLEDEVAKARASSGPIKKAETKQLEKDAPAVIREMRKSDSNIIRTEQFLVKAMLEGNSSVNSELFAKLKIEEFRDDSARSIAELVESLWKSGLDTHAGALLEHTEDEQLRAAVIEMAKEPEILTASSNDPKEESDGKNVFQLNQKKNALYHLYNYLKLRIQEQIAALLAELKKGVTPDDEQGYARDLANLTAEMTLLSNEYEKLKETLW